MVKLGVVLISLVLATAALAQSDCPVCDQASRLRDELRKLDSGNAAQKAQGETLSREGLKLIAGFRDSPPPANQGRKSFEALVALSAYAAPFTPGQEYEKALAAIAFKDGEYRKRYQALMRKGMRARDRRESCQIRYLQTNVEVQECKLEQAAKGATDDLANRRCSASYALDACMAKKK